MRRLVAFGMLAAVLGIACQPGGMLDPPPTRVPATQESPAESPSPPPERPGFTGRIFPIGDSPTRDRMVGSSWRQGCPVPLEDLRLLALSHWGFDGEVHPGELIVHEDEARAVLRVFRRLFRARFPIRRMKLVDEYGGDDDRSMAANNTSAFNCRPVTGGSGWSQHSYGWAIDINPVQNPYVTSDGTVLPPEGAAYIDRARTARGMIHDGDVVVGAFAAIGWEWGGHFQSIKDYQHFSATGG